MEYYKIFNPKDGKRKTGRKNRTNSTNIKIVDLNPNISIISLNVNGLKTPTVRMNIKITPKNKT